MHILKNIQTVIHRFLQIIFSFLIFYIVKFKGQDILHTVRFIHSNIAVIILYHRFISFLNIFSGNRLMKLIHFLISHHYNQNTFSDIRRKTQHCKKIISASHSEALIIFQILYLKKLIISS